MSKHCGEIQTPSLAGRNLRTELSLKLLGHFLNYALYWVLFLFYLYNRHCCAPL